MYQLLILTLETTVFEDSVYSMTVRGGDGYMEILSHHAPLLTLIQPGKVEVRNKDSKKYLYNISTGFLEVSHNKATLFADEIELIPESPENA